MCGIFLIFSRQQRPIEHETTELILKNFNTLRARGPDRYALITVGECLIGFHRLAINDVSENGMQPFQHNGTLTMCNGEIYNYHKLVEEEGIASHLKSRSDCEILPHLLTTYPIADALSRLDAVFAMIHYNVATNTIVVARDRLGVKPVFLASNDRFFAVASEAKALEGMGFDNIGPLAPGTYLKYCTETAISEQNVFDGWPTVANGHSEESAQERIHTLLVEAVKKRMTSDRDIGCLLSGGLDSSIIAAILAREMREKGKTLRTFSVGFPDSTDIVYARKVAAHIQSDHHELILDYNEAIARIPDVIRATETYDTTTIRASTPMFLLCEWISRTFPDKVIFSGEGSDELFCGYLYFHNAPSAVEAQSDSHRLLQELHRYDVLRADRCTSGNGLEFREPFLDRDLVDFVTTMNPEWNVPREVEREKGKVMFEKTILRNAFSSLLPEEVAWRRKAAFSDAVSSNVKPWYQWIQESVVKTEVVKTEVPDLGGTPENNYYRMVFSQHFRDYAPEIPLWLPRWCEVGSEPSATVLKVWKPEEHA